MNKKQKKHSDLLVMAEKEITTSAVVVREMACYMTGFTLERTNESDFSHILLNIKQIRLMESLKHHFVSKGLKSAMMIII